MFLLRCGHCSLINAYLCFTVLLIFKTGCAERWSKMWSKPLICCSCNVLVQDLFPVTLTFPHLLSGAAWSKTLHESCCKQIWLNINEDKASDLFRGLVFLIAHVLCRHRNAKHRVRNVEKYKKFRGKTFAFIKNRECLFQLVYLYLLTCYEYLTHLTWRKTDRWPWVHPLEVARSGFSERVGWIWQRLPRSIMIWTARGGTDVGR